jgi:hypothetical protein
MEKINSAGALLEVESRDLHARKPRSSAAHEELRSLADHELRLVGGGDDTPGWGPKP